MMIDMIRQSHYNHRYEYTRLPKYGTGSREEIVVIKGGLKMLMRRTRNWRFGTQIAALSIALVGGMVLLPAAPSTAASKLTTFRVLWIGDLTGADSAYGIQEHVGITASAKFLNSKGGIDGHKIAITTINSNSDPQSAVSSLISYLSSHSKPNFVFAGTESDSTIAMIPILSKDKILASGSDDGDICATNAQKNCSAFFTENAPTSDLALGGAAYLAKLGVKSIGILEEEDGFSQSETAPMTKALAKVGITATTVSVSATATSVTPEMQQLQTDGVGAVYVEALGATAGYAATARATLNWNAPLLFDFGASAGDLTTIAPVADLANSDEQVFLPIDPSSKLPEIKVLQSAVNKAGGFNGSSIYVACYGWDTLQQVAVAAKAAKSIVTAKIVNKLEHVIIKSPYLMGTLAIRYTPGDHENRNATAADFPVVPVGPYVNGQVQPPAS
jgi:ABC-type branched-subunit amino acid transport system substrate-binding protein